ncbi:MAG TPA: DegV family protein [Fervidobacterium sp.]|nr:DegV family protein [Fervidobacterium sp.]
MKSAVVIDSTTKLSKDYVSAVDIYTVPVRVYVDGKEYRDDDTLLDLVMKTIEDGKNLETSLPSPNEVESLFDELSRKYERIYVLSVSSLLSGTYSLFSTIASNYENVVVFDSKSISIQNTYILTRMISDIESGKNIEENDIISYRDDSIFLISIFNIERLERSGRVNKVLSAISKMMHIKPILTIARTGELELIGKAIANKKVLEIMNQNVNSFLRQENRTKFRMFAAVGKEEYKEYVYNIAQRNDWKPYFFGLGTAILAQVGTEVFGILIGRNTK